MFAGLHYFFCSHAGVQRLTLNNLFHILILFLVANGSPPEIVQQNVVSQPLAFSSRKANDKGLQGAVPKRIDHALTNSWTPEPVPGHTSYAIPGNTCEEKHRVSGGGYVPWTAYLPNPLAFPDFSSVEPTPSSSLKYCNGPAVLALYDLMCFNGCKFSQDPFVFTTCSYDRTDDYTPGRLHEQCTNDVPSNHSTPAPGDPTIPVNPGTTRPNGCLIHNGVFDCILGFIQHQCRFKRCCKDRECSKPADCFLYSCSYNGHQLLETRPATIIPEPTTETRQTTGQTTERTTETATTTEMETSTSGENYDVKDVENRTPLVATVGIVGGVAVTCFTNCPAIMANVMALLPDAVDKADEIKGYHDEMRADPLREEARMIRTMIRDSIRLEMEEQD